MWNWDVPYWWIDMKKNFTAKRTAKAYATGSKKLQKLTDKGGDILEDIIEDAGKNLRKVVKTRKGSKKGY